MLRDVTETISPPQRARLAVLSFDDGPYPVTTPVLLVRLRSLDVPAEFFLIGRDALTQPAIARRIASGRGEVGNHTLTHPEMPALALAEQAREITGGSAAIAVTTGAKTPYFRPPHGSYDAETIRAAVAAGEAVVLWDVDPGDWRSISADAIVVACEKQAHAPAVIILHNGKEATIEALPGVVAAYRHAGFRFVTLSQLQREMTVDEINDPVRVHL